MSKLLQVELKNMFVKFEVKVAIVMFAVLGIFMGYLSKLNGTSEWTNLFEWIVIVIIIVSALGGLFISRDYTQNTIRNKIIVGHTRLKIYLVKQITVGILFVSCCLAFELTMVISNLILIGRDNLNISALITGLLVTFFAVMACSSLTTFIAMTIKKETGGLVPFVILYLMMICGMMGMELSSGKIMDLICDILPVIQIILLNLKEVDSEAVEHIIYSLIITGSCFYVGYVIFRKTDLN